MNCGNTRRAGGRGSCTRLFTTSQPSKMRHTGAVSKPTKRPPFHHKRHPTTTNEFYAKNNLYRPTTTRHPSNTNILSQNGTRSNKQTRKSRLQPIQKPSLHADKTKPKVSNVNTKGQTHHPPKQKTRRQFLRRNIRGTN